MQQPPERMETSVKLRGITHGCPGGPSMGNSATAKSTQSNIPVIHVRRGVTRIGYQRMIHWKTNRAMPQASRPQ